MPKTTFCQFKSEGKRIVEIRLEALYVTNLIGQIYLSIKSRVIKQAI